MPTRMSYELLEQIVTISTMLMDLEVLVLGLIPAEAKEGEQQLIAISHQEIKQLIETIPLISQRVNDLLSLGNKECESAYWRGFAAALKRTRRLDLAREFPETQETIEIIEAQLERARRKRNRQKK